MISIVWIGGAALAGLSGVLLGLTQGFDYQIGFKILLLVFAAVTLGGLGTIWGAILGSFIIGIFIEVSTLFITGRAQVRRCTGRADRRPALPPARPARPSRASGLRKELIMDWHDIFTQSLQQGLGPTAIVYCLAAIGLNVHFGYTGLLNFGQAGFMAVAGYALASTVATWGQSFWLGIVIGLLLTVVLALLLGVPTLRLRADYLAIVTIAAAEIIRQVIGSVTPARVRSVASTVCRTSTTRSRA